MAAEQELDVSVPWRLYMISAFRALEPHDVVISYAREIGGGSITENVQSCIWQHCITKADLKWQGSYLKRLLKKLIFEIESSGGIVLDELYEQYASYMISFTDDNASNGSLRVLKTISFLYPCGCPNFKKLEIQLQCSINMFEGDTGCSLWPSSLFLSEFILSFPELFADKRCFEVGSGVGLVGICLAYVKASKVILSDGDLSTLANMKVNLELNHLTAGNQVHCVCLPWESASEDDLRCFAPDIILGADIIYDPSCLPHLVRVLATLLKHDNSDAEFSDIRELDASQGNETSNNINDLQADQFVVHPPCVEGRVAYIASVIRNIDTFNCFLALAGQANLIITDLTEKIKVSNFLPYLRSYPRSTIRLFKIHL